MKTRAYGLILPALSALLLGLSACDQGAPPLPQDGQYSGFMNNEEVTATLKQLSSGNEAGFTLSLSGQGSSGIQWSFQARGSGGIEVSGPDGRQIFTASDHGDPGADDGCYAGKSDDQPDDSFRLCWSANELHWSRSGPDGSRIAWMDMVRNLADEVPGLETPARYSLDDLVQRAKARNFQSVIAFQQMVLAKSSALDADLNLLPHADAADALNILSGSLYTELKSIGDLVPFLLPSRWFRAAASGDMAASERDSWEVMDLDGVNYVESFAFAEARDEAALASMATERAAIANLRDLVLTKEQVGEAQVGEHDELSTLVDAIDLSTSSLKTIRANELSALAQTAGFYNPEAISGVDFRADAGAPSAADPVEVDFDSSVPLAVSRSIELRQMGDLLAWAQNEAKARVFDWMDPSGDSDGGIGLGLPSYIEVGQDQVAVVKAQAAAVKSDLLRSLQGAILQLQQEETDYKLALEGIGAANGSVVRMRHNLDTGIGFVMSDLINALTARMNAKLALIDAQFGYQIALSRLNRILYRGVYANAARDPKAPG